MQPFASGLSYFVRGGWVMYPLLVCSIAAVTVGINRYLFFKKKDSGKVFTEKFCTLVENNDWEGAKKLADSTEG